MNPSNSSDATLTPTQIARLHQLMDRGDAFVASDVEHCRLALVESSEVQSFAADPSSAACVASRRFSDPRYVGCGAFGIVFFVLDATLGMDVAIKLLRPSRNSAIVQQRFLEEAKITASLSHPGIIRLYDSGTIGSIPYITSTLASGGSLADLLAKHPGGMDARLACELMIQVADAVAFAHSKATFHRDLKPGNILIESDSEQPIPLRAIVSDFGLAKRWNQSSSDAALTLEGDVLGTARYMSPEQARGDLAAFSIASEVFTLGIILYEMLTDRMPFAGDSSAEIRRSIVEHTPERMSHLCRDIPRDLEAIVMQCLEKDPQTRYESVASLARDLRRFRDHEPVEAAKPSWLRRCVWQARKHPVVSSTVALSTLAVCLSLLSISLAWWQQSQARQREYATKMDYMWLLESLIDEVVMGVKDQNTVLIESLIKFQKNVDNDVQLNPGNLQQEHLLSLLLNYQSVLHIRQHNDSEGVRTRIESIAVLKRLREKHPGHAKLRYQYIHNMMALIDLLSSGLGKDQLSYCEQTLGFSNFETILDKMFVDIVQFQTEYPQESDFVLAGYQFCLTISNLRWSMNPEQAARQIDEVFIASRDMADAHPDKLLFIKPAILAKHSLCCLYLAEKRNAEAIRSGNEGLECFDKYLRPHLHLSWVKSILVQLEAPRTEALLIDGQLEQAYTAAAACLTWADQTGEPIESVFYRLATIQYLAAQKMNRVDELVPLRNQLLAKARRVPTGQQSRNQFNWAQQFDVDREVLNLLQERAAEAVETK